MEELKARAVDTKFDRADKEELKSDIEDLPFPEEA
jgi:hypothetical protein